MKTRTGILFSSILASSAILAGCAAGEASNAPAAPPAPAVTTAVVATHELSDWADFTGRLEAVENVAVRPRVGGYVESVGFTEGARVAKGDLLFQIDPRPFQAEVARLTAERDRARAELELARTYRDRARAAARAKRDVARGSRAARSRCGRRAGEARRRGRGARRGAAEPLVHARHRADRRPRVARHRHRRQPRRRRDAADDGRVRLARLRVLRHRRANLSCEHVRHGADVEGSTVHVGLINEQGYPHAARLDFVDNQRRPRPRHDPRARGARQRRRPLHARSVRAHASS